MTAERDFVDDLSMAQDCDAVSQRPVIGSVTSIRRVVLVNGAHLHAQSPSRLCFVKSNLRPYNLSIEVEGQGATYDGLTATYVEIAKLCAIQRNSRNQFKAEQKLLATHGAEHGVADARYGSSPCMLRLGYTEWHINLVLTLEETYSFFRMVSSFNISKYGADGR